jgi:hypothetical protein
MRLLLRLLAAFAVVFILLANTAAWTLAIALVWLERLRPRFQPDYVPPMLPLTALAFALAINVVLAFSVRRLLRSRPYAPRAAS